MMTNFKGKRILSFVVMLAVLTTMITFTLPVSAEDAGTVLWSQNFDGLEASPWSVSIGPGQESSAYKEADNVEVVDGKLVVTKNQLAGTSISTDYVRMAPSLDAVELPDSGYLAFDFDYKQNIDWVGDNPYANILLINDAGKELVGFGFGNQTRGLRYINGNEGQFNAADKNIAPADVFVGKTVSVRLLFDLEEYTYTVYYTPEGGEKVKPFESVAIPSVSAGTLTSGGFDLNNIRFTLACDNETENNGAPVTMTFDNFALTSYDEFPEERVTPHIESTTIVETGMGLTESLKVVFDTPMNFASLSGVKLYKGGLNGTQIAVTPALSTDRLAAYFSHVPLEYNTTYVLSIPDTVLSSTYGAVEGATYTFTTISKTAQHENVVWFEDFDTRTDWDVMEGRAGWGALIKELVGGVQTDASGTGALGDRDNKKGSKVEFREGGIMFTRPQNYGGSVGSNYTNLTVPFTGYAGPEKDYVAVEFDYYQSSEYGSKYSGDISIANSDNKPIFGLNFGSEYYGFQYNTYVSLRPSNFTEYPDFQNVLLNYDTSNDGVVNAHEVPRGNISNILSRWVGKTIKVQILFDIKNEKYIVNYISDGTRYTAVNGGWNDGGWQKMVPGYDFDLAKITFTAACDNAADYPDVIAKYGNVAIVEYSSPEVAFTSVDALSNIETDEPVTITFTEPMMEDTLEGITLKKGSVAVTIDNIELSADGKTATLICDNLDNNATYTLTVPVSVMSEDYFAMEEEYTKTFTTMAADAAPEVKEISFTDGATEVELDKEISVTFNKPMDEDSLANVTLAGDGQSSVALDVTMSNGNKTATFGHADLNYQTVYTLTVPITVKSQDGVFVATEKTYTFTTKTAPTPPIIVSASITDGETGVPVTSEFAFTFDKAMNVDTFANIVLEKVEEDTTTNIPLYVSASNGNKTVKLGHQKLENGAEYTLTVPTSVKAVNNLALSNEVKYTFTTANVAEGETLLYSEYFDTAIGGATGTQANYSGNGWNIYSKVENETAYSDTNKVEFKDGKMVITKEQRITGAEAQNAIYATLDLSTAANMPETGVVAIEYDINYSKKPKATMWYTDAVVSTNINGNSAHEITRLCFSSGSYGWNDKSVTNDVNSGTVITPNEWLQGKDIHVKLVYNLDERTYSMFYTVDGVTYQSPVGVAPFRAQIASTKIAKLAFSYTYRYYDDDPITIAIDNVEVKKLTKPVVTTDSSVVDGQSGVSATERIKIAFNSDMNTNYFKDIKIYEGEVASENAVPTTSVVEDSKTCYIYLDKGLKYSTQYIIDVPSSVISTNLIPVAATDISFTTEMPTIGYGVEFVSVKNGSDFVVGAINGLTTVKAEVKFTNEMCAYLNAPKLVVALCDSEGNIKSISYRKTPVFVGSPQTVAASFTSTIPFESGDYLKAYVLDGTTGSLMSQEVIYNQ